MMPVPPSSCFLHSRCIKLGIVPLHNFYGLMIVFCSSPSYFQRITFLLLSVLFITLVNIRITVKVVGDGDHGNNGNGNGNGKDFELLINPTRLSSKDPTITSHQQQQSSDVSSSSSLASSSSANFTTTTTTTLGRRLRLRRQQRHTATTNQPIAYSNPSTINDDAYFSGCLQIMDDNHYLIEWLAYHYHVMPLRRLIVLMDPNSKTTPAPILERWKDRINITLWYDEQNENDIFSTTNKTGPTKTTTTNNTNTNILNRHRIRQKKFVRNCLLTLKKENRGWVFLVDTDEYISINVRLVQELQPNLVDKLPNPKKVSGSILKILQQNVLKDPVGGHLVGPTSYPCITMSRREFSNKEQMPSRKTTTINTNHHDSSSSDGGLPPSIQFQTKRWKWYTGSFKPGKNLLDLKRIAVTDIPKQPSIHRPIIQRKNKPAICFGKVSLNDQQSVFVIHHYPGTYEQMMFRSKDARGYGQGNNNTTNAAMNATAYRIERYKSYNKKGTVMDVSSGISGWLQGFIQQVGKEEATKLLHNVGLPDQAATFII